MRTRKLAATGLLLVAAAGLAALAVPVAAEASDASRSAGKRPHPRPAESKRADSRFTGEPISRDLKDADLKDVLKTFLQAWQDGKKAEDLKPGITGFDRDWSAGKKLVSFEIKPNEANQGTTLRSSVQLTLKDDKGSESKSTANYNVTTAPAVTVSRDDDD